jgi:hypothetical protein
MQSTHVIHFENIIGVYPLKILDLPAFGIGIIDQESVFY